MPFEWVSTALGGGTVGLFGVLIVFLSVTIYLMQRGRISELKTENAEMRAALTRLTDVIEAWTPERQKRTLRRSS